MKKKSKRFPTIGLALSGGSARGLSYIGFLKVLEKNKIPIDYVAGTSIGAVIGAFYCAGMHAKEMEDIVTKTDWSSLMDFTCEYTGLLDGKKIEDFIREKLPVKTFEDLYIPFAAVAVDVNTGEKIIFNKGDVAEAVRASLSIPGVFTPMKIGNRILVDGGVMDPIPIDVLKGKVNRIIALDLSIPNEKYAYAKAVDGKNKTWLKFKTNLINQEINNLREYLKKERVLPLMLLRLLNPKYLLRFIQGKPINVPPIFTTVLKSHHIMTNELTRLKLEECKPNLLISIDTQDIKFIEFDRHSLLIKAGENSARRNLKSIKSLLRRL